MTAQSKIHFQFMTGAHNRLQGVGVAVTGKVGLLSA